MHVKEKRNKKHIFGPDRSR